MWRKLRCEQKSDEAQTNHLKRINDHVSVNRVAASGPGVSSVSSEISVRATGPGVHSPHAFVARIASLFEGIDSSRRASLAVTLVAGDGRLGCRLDAMVAERSRRSLGLEEPVLRLLQVPCLGDALGLHAFLEPLSLCGASEHRRPPSLIFSPPFIIWAWFDAEPTMFAFDFIVYAHLLVGGLALAVHGHRLGWPAAARCWRPASSCWAAWSRAA